MKKRETIACPVCLYGFRAEVIKVDGVWVRVADCPNCGYTIMGGEWIATPWFYRLSVVFLYIYCIFMSFFHRLGLVKCVGSTTSRAITATEKLMKDNERNLHKTRETPSLS